MGFMIRELVTAEFSRVEEELWSHYHGQTADTTTDRIFGAFDGTVLIGAARVKRHTDGFEVDGVFVLDEYRGHGIARMLMEHILEVYPSAVLWMHAVLELVPFYRTLGFRPVAEGELPPTIKERLVFCMGEMEGCGVAPMVRIPGEQEKA